MEDEVKRSILHINHIYTLQLYICFYQNNNKNLHTFIISIVVIYVCFISLTFSKIIDKFDAARCYTQEIN